MAIIRGRLTSMQLACTVLVYSICVPQCLAFGIIPDHTTSATHSVSATPGLGDYTAAILAGMLLEREAATSTTTRTSTHTTTIITTIYDPHLTATESCRGPLSNCVLFPATAFSPKRAQASAPIPTGDFRREGPPPDSTIVSISPTSSSAQEAHAYIPIATGDFGLEGSAPDSTTSSSLLKAEASIPIATGYFDLEGWSSTCIGSWTETETPVAPSATALTASLTMDTSACSSCRTSTPSTTTSYVMSVAQVTITTVSAYSSTSVFPSSSNSVSSRLGPGTITVSTTNASSLTSFAPSTSEATSGNACSSRGGVCSAGFRAATVNTWFIFCLSMIIKLWL